MSHSPKPSWHSTNGPRDAKLVIVAEAHGENEALLQSPLVGASGFELSRMVYEAGLVETPPLPQRAYSNMMLQEWWKGTGILLTNVFAFRPPNNKLEALCSPRKEVGADYWRQPLGKGGYVRPEYLGELERLKEELSSHPRHCIIALGATATWALMNQPKISAVRGVATLASALCPTLKVVPTYHPAGVLRNWSWRPIAIADLTKVAQREGRFPEVIRPEREVYINPTLKDVLEFFARPAPLYSVDVETFRGQISMVGFAPSIRKGIVIPLIDRRKHGWSYWTPSEEIEIHKVLRRVMEDTSILKLGQNFLYDTQYFWRSLRIRVRGVAEDTMLLQHSLMPEMQKSLGFLGSVHTNEASWKLFRSREQEELKRDE